MKKIIFTNKFSKEYALMHKRGKNVDKIKHIIELLKQDKLLPAKFKDHKLIGSYEGSRELHIEPDWLLVYKVSEESIVFERTGTHSDLFK
ncbi:MAG: type II toxin-antitoxin system YafQ family toxin [Pseudomonadota bacterium]